MTSHHTYLQIKAVLSLFVAIICGCEEPQSVQKVEPAQNAVAVTPAAVPSPTQFGDPTPAEAKEKLTAALDAWVLGDSAKKLQAEHQFVDLEDMSSVLMRYEIGPMRVIPNARTCEAAVTLVFQSKAGTELKKQKKFNISHNPDGTWGINKS